jgi:hypothetical protein
MSMENKIDSRERLLDEVVESTHFSHIRARKFFAMRDAASLIDNGSDGSWLVSRVYDGKVMYEHLGFDEAYKYEESWLNDQPEYITDVTVESAVKNIANWRAYIDKHLSHEYWWLFREAYRFINGNYTPALLVSQLHQIADTDRNVCMTARDTLSSRVQSLWWHFPHISIDAPNMVAYTPNPEYGVRDRQVRTKVGRYLQQFYGDLITSEQIRSMANGTKQLDLEFDSDIRAAYLRGGRDGVTSCMTHPVGHCNYSIRGAYHPVDVYQTGEFKVALLHDGFNNEICARALVYEPSRVFVRCYGREANTLQDRLTEKSYSEQNGWDNGIRLRVIRDDDDKVVVPYMDGRTQSGSIEYHEGKEWLVVDRSGDVDMSTQHGIWEEEELQYCDACEDSVQCGEDDMEYSSYHGMNIGPCCIDDFRRAHVAARGRGSMDWVRGDETVECACDGEDYVTDNLDEFGIVYCEVTEDYRFSRNLVPDVRGEDIPEEYAYEVENTVNSGETAYVYHQDHDRLFEMVLERVDGDCKRWLYQPHHSLDVDEDEAYLAFVQRYESARTVVDDFGNLVKPDYMTLAELVHYFGIGHGCELFRKHSGIWVNTYIVERRLNATQAVAA